MTKLIQKIKEETSQEPKCIFDHSNTLQLVSVHQDDGTWYRYCYNCKWIDVKEIISQNKEETIKQYSSVRNKLVDMYRKRKGITIPNELAELALKLIEKKTKQELIEELDNIIEIWFAVHDKTTKSFMTDDFRKFIKEKLSNK